MVGSISSRFVLPRSFAHPRCWEEEETRLPLSKRPEIEPIDTEAMKNSLKRWHWLEKVQETN